MPRVVETDSDRRRRHKALALVGAGVPKSEVARRVKRSRWTIYRWCDEVAVARAASADR